MQAYELDAIDERLIATLASFPRAGLLQLARKVGVARNTAQAHLDRLLAAGVITGFGPDLDLRRLGYAVSAFVSLEISQGRGTAVEDHLRRFWDPRMRSAIVAHLDAGGAGLLPLVKEAVENLRPGLPQARAS